LNNKVKIAFFSAIGLSIAAFFSIQHIINPIHVYQLIGTYLLAFAAYTIFINPRVQLKTWHIFALGLFFRLLMFSTPTLSDDFYRFYWDGKLLIEGINPYSLTPKMVFGSEVNDIQVGDEPLYELLNSKNYYSVYPPFLQYVFSFSALIGNSLQGFVWVLSSLVLLAELGIFFLLKKLLGLFNQPISRIAVYWLNPLIIIELNGNLHSEVFMLLAIAAALYFHKTNKSLLAGMVLGFAVLTKLYPILFVPYFLIPFKFKNAAKLGLGLIISLLALSIPILNMEHISHILESVDLYYAKFEFNGSIYNIMKHVGYKLTGYNQIVVIGKILSTLTLIGFGILYYFRYKTPSKFPILWSIYIGMILFYLLSTTIMPWYLSLIVLASVFNKSNVGLAWSALIVLSYSAFSNIHFEEDLALVMIEYYTIAVIIVVELRKYFRQRIFESN
jgi:Gpi18-like mannosyltransferase